MIDPTERLRRAELLLEISRSVASLGSLDEILESLVETTTAELGAERGTLFRGAESQSRNQQREKAGTANSSAIKGRIGNGRYRQTAKCAAGQGTFES